MNSGAVGARDGRSAKGPIYPVREASGNDRHLRQPDRGEPAYAHIDRLLRVERVRPPPARHPRTRAMGCARDGSCPAEAKADRGRCASRTSLRAPIFSTTYLHFCATSFVLGFGFTDLSPAGSCAMPAEDVLHWGWAILNPCDRCCYQKDVSRRLVITESILSVINGLRRHFRAIVVPTTLS
jgi:hypothetical protein